MSDNKDYARGYNAGRKRTELDAERYEAAAKRIADAEKSMWWRAFEAAIPAAFSAQGWMHGEKEINSLGDRIGLAARAADHAMTAARVRGMA